MKVLRQGKGSPVNVLVMWHVGATGKQIMASVPNATVLQANDPKELLRLDVLLPGVAIGELAFVGYSAGAYYGVRQALSNHVPQAVFAFDGAHASKPIGESADTWRALAESAKVEGCLFVLTHTYMTYVEQLPRPYSSTLTVARLVSGAPLPMPPTYDPKIHRQGDLVIYSYRSATIDAPAHGRQLTQVAPMVVRDWLGARWGGQDIASGETVAGLVEGALDTAQGGLGARLLAWARGELATGVREEPPGSNDGPRIREYFSAPFRRDDKPIHVAKAPWCAAAVGFGIHAVAGPGEAPTLRVSGIEYEQDAKKNGTWSNEPRIGDLAILRRTGSDPKKASWERHVAIVSEVGPDSFTTVGGNENNAWKETRRTLSHPDVLGFVRL